MRHSLFIELGLSLTLVALCAAVITSVSESRPPSRASTPSKNVAASVPATRF